MKKVNKYRMICIAATVGCMLLGCGKKEENAVQIQDIPKIVSNGIEIDNGSYKTSVIDKEDNTSYIKTRDNTPICLIPEAAGIKAVQNDKGIIDCSHAEQGYIMAKYTGDVEPVKLRVTGADEVTYTYDLHKNQWETFPLTSNNGSYQIKMFENIGGTSYVTCLYQNIQVQLEDEFGPFLYPNQFVNFTKESKAVKKAEELVQAAESDLDAIKDIYDFIIQAIKYDYNKAADPPAGYLTDVDAILDSGTGICLDYAAVMAAMLRSQRIPTRLEVGYAGKAYHAWISIYTEETGWLNGIIEFAGNQWTLVDPTFAANNSAKTLKKYIGKGDYYTLQKIY